MKANYEMQNRLLDVIRAKEQEGFSFKPNNQFYRTLGIHKRRFGQFMRNEKQPTLHELGRIAETFSVELDELINNKKLTIAANSTG